MLNKLNSFQNKEWSWYSSTKGKYLQSESLKKNGFRHGFFTKEWGNQSPKELASLLSSGFSIHLGNQVHGSNVIEASIANREPWPVADGLISDQKGQSLWIYSADCIPVLFADPTHGFVAASHAGWRGIAKGILLKTIEKLEYMGSNRNEIIIALGPAISGKNYKVSRNIAESIYESIYEESKNIPITNEKKIALLVSLGIVSYDTSPNKLLLDIRLAAANQLFEAGIKYPQISICPLCTYSNQVLFNSWRRNKSKTRQWSFIAS